MSSVPPSLVAALAEARHVAVLTGSGISAESGIPTFRDAQTGLWARYSPEELATPEAFARDPQLVWRWYRWRRELVRAAQPNAGHRALVELAGLSPQLTLVTQNVDGLHQRAGARDVIEFHGNLFDERCGACSAPHTPAHDDPDGAAASLPRCLQCGGLLRPGVVWFGEAIPARALVAAEDAAQDCDVFLSVGTSSLVFPAAALASSARHHGATVVEVNPNATPLTGDADFVLAAPAGQALVAALTSTCGSARAPGRT
jgi:NAD-dependent deacetylase